jgi:hypothetical protein
MKTLPLLILLSLALSACSKSPSRQTPAPAPRDFTPARTNVEMFIENYAHSNHAKAQGYLQFMGHAGVTSGCSIKDADGREYSVALEYRGTENSHDFYWASYSVPSGLAIISTASEIAYFGSEIDLWTNSQWRIGIRPHEVQPNVK